MSAERRTGFLFTRRGKLLFCAGGLLFSLLFLAWTLEIEFTALLPSEERLTALREEAKKAQSKHEELAARYAQISATESAYFAEIADYWYAPEHGDPESEPRQLLETMLKNAGLRSLNLSSVRRSRVNAEIYALEMDLTGNAALEPLTSFLRTIQENQPRIFWKRVELRSDPRSGDGLLFFSGTLRMMGREKALPTAKGGVKK